MDSNKTTTVAPIPVATPTAIPGCNTTYEIIKEAADEYQDCPGVKKGNTVTVVPTETKSFDSTRSSA